MSRLQRIGSIFVRTIEKNYIFHNNTAIFELRFCRDYSVFPPYYIDPIYKKDKIDDLVKTGEAQKLAHIPFKPAKENQTCSVFHDELVRKFTNHIMKQGKKELARDLLEKTFENIKRSQLERYHSLSDDLKMQAVISSPQELLEAALKNVQPLLQLTPIKRGGVRYQVPVPVSERRSEFLAIKWLLTAARDKERTVHLPEKLAWEIMDAASNQGRVVKRKQELHRQCEANRAYAHYRWS